MKKIRIARIIMMLGVLAPLAPVHADVRPCTGDGHVGSRPSDGDRDRDDHRGFCDFCDRHRHHCHHKEPGAAPPVASRPTGNCPHHPGSPGTPPVVVGGGGTPPVSPPTTPPVHNPGGPPTGGHTPTTPSGGLGT